MGDFWVTPEEKAAGALSPDKLAQIVRKYEEDGLCVLRNVIPHEVLDRCGAGAAGVQLFFADPRLRWRGGPRGGRIARLPPFSVITVDGSSPNLSVVLRRRAHGSSRCVLRCAVLSERLTAVRGLLLLLRAQPDPSLRLRRGPPLRHRRPFQEQPKGPSAQPGLRRKPPPPTQPASMQMMFCIYTLQMPLNDP